MPKKQSVRASGNKAGTALIPLPPTRRKGDVTERVVLPVSRQKGNEGSDIGEKVLRFSPYAWAKLQFMCHAVTTEIGGMGITAADDPLFVTDIAIIQQQVTVAGVSFEDDSLSDHMMRCCDPDGEFKLQPLNCMRIWIHTHPSGITTPSGVDEETFSRAFGAADWAVMFILARSGEVYARMRGNTSSGFSISARMRCTVAWDKPFKGSDHAQWEKEITENVFEVTSITQKAWDDSLWADGIPCAVKPTVASTYYSPSTGIYGEKGANYTPTTVVRSGKVGAGKSSSRCDLKFDVNDDNPLFVLGFRERAALFENRRELRWSDIGPQPGCKLSQSEWGDLVDTLRSFGVVVTPCVGNKSYAHVLFKLVDPPTKSKEGSLGYASTRLPMLLQPSFVFGPRVKASIISDYKKAEKCLYSLSARRFDRIIVGRAEEFVDSVDEVNDIIFPYRSSDGLELYLSAEELSILDNIYNGVSLYSDEFSLSGLPFGDLHLQSTGVTPASSDEPTEDDMLLGSGVFEPTDNFDSWRMILHMTKANKELGGTVAQLKSLFQVTINANSTSVEDLAALREAVDFVEKHGFCPEATFDAVIADKGATLISTEWVNDPKLVEQLRGVVKGSNND